MNKSKLLENSKIAWGGAKVVAGEKTGQNRMTEK